MAAISKLSRRTLLLLLWHLIQEKKQVKHKRRMRIRQLFKERKNKGSFNLLFKDLQLYDHEYFFKSFRMKPSKYEQLLQLISPKIIKCSFKLILTFSRRSIGQEKVPAGKQGNQTAHAHVIFLLFL